MPVIDFFFAAHDPALIVLAATICLVSAYACIGLTRHAGRTEGQMRHVWTAIAAMAVGFGIWATHFVAILAFRPGFTLSYDLWLTALSLVIAICVCGAGIAMASRGRGRSDRFLGGAVVGLGISAMHYTGIAALIMGGRLDWNPALVSLSVLAGIVLGGMALVVGLNGTLRRVMAGALMLTLAICGMHFTGMAAADFSLCFPLTLSGEVDGFWLSVALTGISVLVLALALGSTVLDEADRRRTERERERELRDAEQISAVTQKLELAMTHMAQGLGLYGADGRLQLYNQRLPLLLGIDPSVDLHGISFRDTCRLTIIGDGPVPDDIEKQADATVTNHTPLITNGGEIAIPFAEDKVLQVSHSPIGDGSWVTTVEDITERHKSQRAIAHLARHDSLTGLPNRARFKESFEQALETAREAGAKIAVIAIDLDHFKEINDSHGHAAGDMVLKTLAGRFNALRRDDEVIARLGGDEFAAIKVFSGMENLRDFLTRIEDALNRRIDADDLAIPSRGSIGVAVWPKDGDELSKLMSNADLAMYRAKTDFDHHICYYERDMDEQARARREMARDLWLALDQNAFYLVYQVQKSVATGETTGYEVLLRWNRPGYGDVSPAEFIPVAEECGAINAIGVWVLKMACMDAASWPEPHKIAVNVSGLQLAQVDLIDTVRSTLFMTGLAPERLELEVTETAIIGDKQRALHILRQIRAMGVSIAIDDFGTGYSSLDTLRSFPFDKIKLDRSFMSEVESNEQSKAIVRAILALGRSLSVPVLAEGVETPEQLAVLRKEGCTEAQGFLLGRPGAIDWDDRAEAGMTA